MSRALRWTVFIVGVALAGVELVCRLTNHIDIRLFGITYWPLILFLIFWNLLTKPKPRPQH